MEGIDIYTLITSILTLVCGGGWFVNWRAKKRKETAEARQTELNATITEQELCKEIDRLNADDDVDGILVQLPLPAHINEEHVIRAIRAEKDVDGFHPTNAAHLWLHQPLVKAHVATIYNPVPDYGCTIACTPKGILSLLASTGVALDGKRAVMVGRSDIVGKPMAKLLMDRQPTWLLFAAKRIY